MDTTRIDAGKGSGGTSQRRFFRFVHLWLVPPTETTINLEKNRGTALHPLFSWTPMMELLRSGGYSEVDTQCISAAGGSGAHCGQALEGDNGEASHARHISETGWFDVVWGRGETRPRSSTMCGLPKRSLFDALALFDVWHLRYSSSTRAS